jgi:glutaredoxin 3
LRERTEEFLRDAGVEFTTRSIAKDEEALAELERIGTMTTPVTLIDGEEVVGFDRRRLRQLLGL